MKTGDVMVIDRWANVEAEENAMQYDHYHLWMEMIRQIEEPSLEGMNILDYGCNQGGFLNVLYGERPFAAGQGVDVANLSVAYANKHKNPNAPLSYDHVDVLDGHDARYDMAFSHEVIYLLDDLQAHAHLMNRVLKDGGVYYAAIGCHTDNPQWERWAKLIGEYSNIKVQDYSLDDYADAFFNEGFNVSARPYQMQGFVPLKQNNRYFPKVNDSLLYHSYVKTLFKFQKAK